MRCWQNRGLLPEAITFLEENCVKVKDQICPHCDCVLSWKLLVLSERLEECFYGEGPILHTYELKTGGTVQEIIQAEPLSSGPVTFLCLELEDGKRIGEWSEEDINNA